MTSSKACNQLNSSHDRWIKGNLPSGTVPTDGTWFLGNFSSDGAEMAFHRLCVSTMVGLALMLLDPVLGPQVLPLTPSAGTVMVNRAQSGIGSKAITIN